MPENSVWIKYFIDELKYHVTVRWTVPPTCKIHYVNMKHNYVDMQRSYVNMQHIIILTRYNMWENYVNMWLEILYCMSVWFCCMLILSRMWTLNCVAGWHNLSCIYGATIQMYRTAFLTYSPCSKCGRKLSTFFNNCLIKVYWMICFIFILAALSNL